MPDDLDQLGADYREAKAAVIVHRRAQAEAELARSAHLKARARDRKRQAQADDPKLEQLDTAVTSTLADVRWCQSLVVACGEELKGVPLAEAIKPREIAEKARAKVDNLRAGIRP